MLSREIRGKFLQFFKEKGHSIIPSSPVVPMGDPTLLFINAGMNQFKDVFLGKSVREYITATTAQKCIRVGGKHNDLENVGHTRRHLTFFEMLGNFSFGDYFKKAAIAYAWELTQSVFKFDPSKLWATVFHEDEESFELWKNYLPEQRIIRMGEKDNFWAMGDIGPCGPCTELYFDKGAQYSHARNPAEDIDGERFLEFWNLVFMEFNRGPNNEMERLPKLSVDTGAGLERIVSLKMEVDSLFETDILRELIAQVEIVSGRRYETQGEKAAPFRVIADHIRTLAFAIADGVQPSNIERGYVLRKVLRRAVRYGRQLGLDKPFLGQLLPRLILLMGDDFPELKKGEGRVHEILTLEEEAFQRTLKKGGNILNQIIADSEKRGQISGEDAFKLKDTYGLPIEEILLLAKDVHLAVDIRTFEEFEHEAKRRSRGARKTTDQVVESSIFEQILQKKGPSNFIGYGQLSSESIVLSILKDGTEVSTLYEGESGSIFLDQTPFYAEKGGQIGDQGTLFSDMATFDVIDCQSPFPDITIHMGVVKKGELKLGDRVSAAVDATRRRRIANNHTAIHLLHWALREVLGHHVKQAGSIVEPDRLRFDFSHHKALTKEEIEQIEDLVNGKIRENSPIHVYEMPYADIQKRDDIVHYFGDKYGSTVRVIDIDFSKELCGGTHTSASGTIGYFRILKEGSIAAGLRRIEGVTGEAAESFAREEKDKILTVQKESAQENKDLLIEIARLKKAILAIEVNSLLTHQIPIGQTHLLAQAVEMTPEDIKECADQIMKKGSSLVLFLIGKQQEKCNIVIRVSPDLISQGIKAIDVLKEVAPLIDGKGGGKADAAQGGGTDLEKIPLALKHARTWLEQKIS